MTAKKMREAIKDIPDNIEIKFSGANTHIL